MNWERTVLSDGKLKGLDYTYDFTPTNSADVDRHYRKVIAKAQAKVSYEAGRKSFENDVIAKARNSNWLGLAHEGSVAQGRKEVVDWIEEHQMPDKPSSEPYRGLVLISKVQMEEKCKEWGL